MSGACGGCKPIFYASQRNQRTLDTNRTVDRVCSQTDVSATAIQEAGNDLKPCPICANLWEGICAYAGGRVVKGDIKMELWRWRKGQESLFLEFHINGDSVSVEFYTPSTAPRKESISYFGVKQEIKLNSGSDETLEMLRGWVHECAATHTECSVRKIAPLPPRTIDVGEPGSESSIVKLYVRQDVEDRQKFAALCYSWGDTRFATTTKGNFQKRTEGIDITILPKTFQDAILITRKLGLRYLWIDALCIIQDDPEDWSNETSRMSRIFGSAYFTISSTWSDSCSKGIFTTRFADDATKRSLDLSKQHGRARRKIDHNFRSARSPLLTRAWTLQEHILSRRVIHFDAEEIRLECKRGTRCECSDEHMPKLKETPFTGPSELSSLTRAKLFRTWWDLVEEYTMRNLSVPSDKLPAFYGMATRMQIFGVGAYTAGLWDNELIASLAWTTAYQPNRDFPKKPKHRPMPYRAPTWSWASVDAQVAYPPLHINIAKNGYEKCQIVEVHCEPDGPAGAVKSAHISVRAQIAQVMIDRPSAKAEREDHQQQWGIRRKNARSWFTPDAPLDDTDGTRYKQSLRSRFFAQESGMILLLAAGIDSFEDTHVNGNGKSANARPGEESWQGLALVLRRSQSVFAAWERIGLALLREGEKELLKFGREEVLTII